jgi:hypothetical protein
MNRRDFLNGVQGAFYSAAAAALASPSGAAKPAAPDGPAQPRDIGLGPQLFLDQFLIDRIEGLRREVQAPQRLARPVLDSKTFGTTQPYLSVVHDRAGQRFRMWYNRGPSVWHAESADGIHWAKPRLAWNVARGYGASLVDDGARATDPRRRYKIANWQGPPRNQAAPAAGMHVAFSPDGFDWTAHNGNPVLPSWPQGQGKVVAHGVGDIVDVYYDPLAQLYRAALKLPALASDGYAPGPRAGNTFRRLVGISSSRDFVDWERPRRILTPDARDDGLLEFYGMGGMHLRGRLHIGLVRVLRDDLPCDPGGPRDGIGYTVLATSRDGVTWQRLREPFLDRNPERGSWDHAMTWMSAALPAGDEIYFYYGGYARGHKVAAATERQIGLARMKRDRYLALTTTRDEGTLLTQPFVVPGGRLTINARAARGQVRVRILAPDGRPMPDFGDAAAIAGDVLVGEARWVRPLASLRGQPVRLEFRLRQAALFGFEFHAT